MRKRRGQPITVQLSDDLFSAIASIAEAEARTLAGAARVCIAEALANRGYLPEKEGKSA